MESEPLDKGLLHLAAAGGIRSALGSAMMSRMLNPYHSPSLCFKCLGCPKAKNIVNTELSLSFSRSGDFKS